MSDKVLYMTVREVMTISGISDITLQQIYDDHWRVSAFCISPVGAKTYVLERDRICIVGSKNKPIEMLDTDHRDRHKPYR